MTPSVPVVESPLPFTGTRADRLAALRGGLLALALTIAYATTAWLVFDTPTTWIEAGALWAAIASVWLARLENIWCMPFGIVAVVLLGWGLFDVGLVAQAWLQYIYFVPIQVAGWWAWSRGGEGRTELSITRLDLRGWLDVVFGTLGLWIACEVLFDILYADAIWLVWDSSIFAASITAQTLMTFKKRESWWFWTLPVNLSNVGLFIVTGQWAFMVLYLLFLANSVWAWRDWDRAEATGAPA
jgi:nicotinamide mononucleotide transporter